MKFLDKALENLLLGRMKEAFQEIDDLESKIGEVASSAAGSVLARNSAADKAVDEWVRSIYLRNSSKAARVGADILGGVAKKARGGAIGLALYEMFKSAPTNRGEQVWLDWFHALPDEKQREILDFSQTKTAPHEIFYREAIIKDRRRERLQHQGGPL